MNHLIGKLKGNEYRKIISEQVIYSLPNEVDSAIPYSPSTILDEQEWFKIENFSSQSYFIELLREEFNSTDYMQYNHNEHKELEYICSYQNDNEFYFQKIYKTHLLKKKLISIGDAISYEENKKCIIINDIPDAIYLRDRNILYFRKLTMITSIFEGISEIYREATQTEVDGFLNSDFIRLGEGYSADKVGISNRRKIAIAMERLNEFQNEEKVRVFNYIAQYCPNLNFSNNSFEIASEKELKSLLYGIEQRYFTTPIGEEKRLANSIIKIE